MENKENIKIAVIGLGYVGLPLAINFGKHYNTIGFDIDSERIKELKDNFDITKELTSEQIKSSMNIHFSNSESDLIDANVYIVTVPTPINKSREPNLSPIFNASRTIGKYLNKDDIVVYESTVYPGCTEEDCVPILESESNLKYKKDFFCGYSPERIVPGDKDRTLTKIKKIVSGTDKKTTIFLDKLYNSIIDAGTFIASSIKVAEAAKSIENAQRDINIAFVNELALIFDRMDINTNEVLEAASTKWNFLPFKPGLVGGHCIGVDPYYLAYKSASYGHHPKLILAGREINDNMSEFVVKKIMNKMVKNDILIENSSILILGITFKENCPDIRNTKVIDVINFFKQFKCNVDVCDPVADKEQVREALDLDLIPMKKINKKYDCVVKLVSHEEFDKFNFTNQMVENGVIFDLKGSWEGFEVLTL